MVIEVLSKQRGTNHLKVMLGWGKDLPYVLGSDRETHSGAMVVLWRRGVIL